MDEIRAYHEARSPGGRAVCDKLAAALDAGLPEAEAKVWHGHPVWFIDGNPIAGYSELNGGVRLLFWSGQSFATPGLAPQGKFKAAEVRYADPSQIDADTLAAWLEEARRVQWDYKNIVKRKGRLDPLTGLP